MSDVEVHGPIDFLLIEFAGDRPRGGSAAAVADLLARDVIRLYDVLVLRRAEDGGVSIVDLEAEPFAGYEAFAGARSGLLGDDDIATAGDLMTPGTTAVLFVYENAWAIPFVGAALGEGGTPVAKAQIAAVDVMAALDELDARAGA